MSVEEEATGVKGANGYIEYATSKGYPIVRVVDWTSSAGDWTFIVSNDNKNWKILSQENNYPRAGFSYYLSEEIYQGSEEEVLEMLYENC